MRTERREQRFAMKKIALAVFCGFMTASVGRASVTDDMSSRVWRVRDGLPQNAVQALVQTPDGYLWIGTNGGLVRFDGTEFRLFGRHNTPELAEDSILQLYVDAGGVLWIGTEGGGLVSFRAGHFNHFGSAQGLSNGFVRAIFEDGQRRLWVGTDRGLFAFRKGRLDRVDAKNGLPSINVYSISEDWHERLMIGCTDASNAMGILAFDPHGRAIWYKASQTAGDQRVWLLHRARNGELWIGAGRQLWRWPIGYVGDLFATQGIVHPLATALSSVWRPKPITVTSLEEDSGGNLWLGTSNEGVFRIDDRGTTHFDALTGLSDNSVQSMLQDLHGNLWVGTANGLTRLRESAAGVVMAANESPLSIKTVYQSSDGTLWATSSGDELMRVRRRVLEPVCLQNIPCRLAVRTVFEDGTHRFWVGTAGQGLFVISPTGRVAHYPELDLIRAFAEAPDGTVWIGMDSGLTHMGGRLHEHLNGDGGLGSDSVRALVFDRSGRLWVGTDGGVAVVRDGHVVPMPQLAPMRGKKVYAILEDREGAIWCGTRGAGLWLWAGGALKHFDFTQGLLSDNILGLVEGPSGKLWISSSEGIFSVQQADLMNPRKGASPIPMHLFGESEGVNNSQMNGAVQPSVWRAASGDLWFASSSGAVELHPQKVSQPAAFPVLIDRIVSGGQDLHAREQLKLAPDQQNFEIHYAAINLDSPEHVRFSYRLEGFDPAWIDAGERRTAFYTNVPPGSYRFVVQAYDSDSPLRPAISSIWLTRMPAWYQTRWFLLSCMLALGLVVLTIHRLHVRRMRMQFEAVLEERNRLAREMHDTIIQGCVGVSTLLEAAATTQGSAPELSQKVLARARYQIHETVEDARRSVWNLRRQQASCDLAESLREMTRRLSQESEVQVHCECEPESVLMEEQRHHEMLSIAREAAANALKHARASTIMVHLALTMRQVLLSVADDGQGFTRSHTNGRHYGLIGMEERARKLGGSCIVTSAPGDGTCISISIPLLPHSNFDAKVLHAE
jgi:ligand-binding sensor domain-containing protein/two-component sensor histidine kinase